LEALRRGTVDFIGGEDLARKLARGTPLRVKLGVDPTSAHLHLGHAVVLSKLRAFQDLGHLAVLIIGDFTAAIGDPSGRDASRPPLSAEAVAANAKTYTDQAFKVLDRSRTQMRFNSEWLEPFLREGLLPVLRRVTIGQVIEREDFRKRIAEGSPITLLEALYPILQGQDSVAVRADVELGGTDQLFNLLMGRQMQKDAGQEPQAVVTLPLLEGIDGVRKMSKSYGNSVGIDEAPRDMFGKLMKISDALMLRFYELLSDRDLSEVKALHPMEAKKSLAEALTGRFHGEAAARAEREFFERTFSRREVPGDLPAVEVPGLSPSSTWSQLLVLIGATASRKEAQRLLAQGAVKAQGEALGPDAPLGPGPFSGETTLQVGRRKFFKLRLAG
jgi:tyrosyl-tRNA synthetase